MTFVACPENAHDCYVLPNGDVCTDKDLRSMADALGCQPDVLLDQTTWVSLGELPVVVLSEKHWRYDEELRVFYRRRRKSWFPLLVGAVIGCFSKTRQKAER